MTSGIAELAATYSRLWDESVEADNACFEDDCYGDLPKDRGPHVLGRSEKGLAASQRHKEICEAKNEVAKELRSSIEKMAGIDAWKLRCLFV